MPTRYQQILRDIVHRGMAEVPTLASAIIHNLELMRDKAYPPWLVNAVVQRPGLDWDIYDSYCVAWVHTMHELGRLAIKTVDMGRGCFADKQAEENNQYLERLPEPFRAQFFGGAGGDDGWLRWGQPVAFGIWHCREAEMKPCKLPLEVGATNYGRTLAHIMEDGGVARWPYDTDRMVVFRLIPDPPEDRPPASAARKPPLVTLADGTEIIDLAEWRRDRRASRQSSSPKR